MKAVHITQHTVTMKVVPITQHTVTMKVVPITQQITYNNESGSYNTTDHI